MNDQLKHDTAVAAAHAAVELFPGCLLPAERDEARACCAQAFRAALDAYDHFRTQEGDTHTDLEPVCDEPCCLEPQAL